MAKSSKVIIGLLIGFVAIAAIGLGRATAPTAYLTWKVAETEPAEPLVPDPPEAPDWQGGVPVLLYHHIAPSNENGNGAVVTTAEFEAQMNYLAEHGYRSISTTQLARWLAGHGRLPEKPVLVTFDDGYASNHTIGFPILKRHNIKATIFVIGSFPGETLPKDAPGPASWAELREMQESGLIELQSHTYDGHRKVDGRAALLRWSSDQIAADDKLLREAFSAAGLRPPTAIAYPFGGHDDKAVQAMASAGYRLGFTVKGGLVRRGADLLRLPRQVIFPGFTLEKFARKLQ